MERGYTYVAEQDLALVAFCGFADRKAQNIRTLARWASDCPARES